MRLLLLVEVIDLEVRQLAGKGRGAPPSKSSAALSHSGEDLAELSDSRNSLPDKITAALF